MFLLTYLLTHSLSPFSFAIYLDDLDAPTLCTDVVVLVLGLVFLSELRTPVVQVAERQHLRSAGRRLSSCQEYSLTRTAVVRSTWLVRPSGTHWATICAIQTSASPASLVYLRRICFSSTCTRCTERIRGTMR